MNEVHSKQGSPDKNQAQPFFRFKNDGRGCAYRCLCISNNGFYYKAYNRACSALVNDLRRNGFRYVGKTENFGQVRYIVTRQPIPNTKLVYTIGG